MRSTTTFPLSFIPPGPRLASSHLHALVSSSCLPFCLMFPSIPAYADLIPSWGALSSGLPVAFVQELDG
eukprot:CAMPEP_0206631206 /NCGR_PEP_ID=MMETSP0325_2-20121206/68049_1 /ASSEMBLY_ACC=CAM_ASM_000347 /TAXON_ID=2866 /ORGANISM="Crypthecodinium cohnii, Strain Seligo" /LENGTH=68 /DNA_ID=CAMNT_0054156249 /DNA_START=71 /DNA_END=274 /DNA_ORIENTATION=+